MNRTSRKLVLHRETLRPLNSQDLLQAAAGAVTDVSCNCQSARTNCCYRLTTPVLTL